MSTDIDQSATVSELKPGFNERIASLITIDDPEQFERERKAIAKELKMRTSVVDDAIEKARNAASPPAGADATGGADSNGPPGKVTPRQKLLQVVHEQGMRFWRNSDSTAYVTVPCGDRIERYRVQSTGFKNLLRSLYGSRWPEATKTAIIPGGISETTMAEVMPTLE